MALSVLTVVLGQVVEEVAALENGTWEDEVERCIVEVFVLAVLFCDTVEHPLSEIASVGATGSDERNRMLEQLRAAKTMTDDR